MLKNAIGRLVRPLVSRIGTALAALLVAQGFDSPLVEQAVNAGVAFVLVCVDLLLAEYYRKAEVAKAVDETAMRFAYADYQSNARQPGELFSNE